MRTAATSLCYGRHQHHEEATRTKHNTLSVFSLFSPRKAIPHEKTKNEEKKTVLCHTYSTKKRKMIHHSTHAQSVVFFPLNKFKPRMNSKNGHRQSSCHDDELYLDCLNDSSVSCALGNMLFVCSFPLTDNNDPKTRTPHRGSACVRWRPPPNAQRSSPHLAARSAAAARCARGRHGRRNERTCGLRCTGGFRAARHQKSPPPTCRTRAPVENTSSVD